MTAHTVARLCAAEGGGGGQGEGRTWNLCSPITRLYNIRSNNIFDFQIEYVSVLLAVWMDGIRAVRKRKSLFTSVDKIPVYALLVVRSLLLPPSSS